MIKDPINYILSKLSDPCKEDEEDARELIESGWEPDQIVKLFYDFEYMTEE